MCNKDNKSYYMLYNDIEKENDDEEEEEEGEDKSNR